LGRDGVAANGDTVKVDGVGMGKFLWGWGGDGADAHYRVTF